MAAVTTNGVMVSVILLMLGVGLRTAWGGRAATAGQYGLLLRGLLANFVVVPVLFFLALTWGPFRPDVVIGLLIMAAVPIAPMVPALVGAADGDVPYAIGLMTLVALLCVPLTPLLLDLCLPESEAGLVLDPLAIIRTLLMVQLIPVGLGMVLRHSGRTWVRSLLSVVTRAAGAGLVVSVVLMITDQYQLIMELGVLPHLAVILAIVVGLAVGDFMMLGEPPARRRSLALATGTRNVALGLLIVNGNYPETPAVAVVLVFGILSMVLALAYGKLRARPAP